MIANDFIHLDNIIRFAPRSFWQRHSPAAPILNQISLRLQSQETVGLVGASGSGKTSLLKVMLALDAADRGAMSCEGRAIAPASVASLAWYRRRVQYIPQDPASALAPHHSVAQLIAEPLHHLLGLQNVHQRVAELCDRVQLPRTLLHVPAGQLSGGQAQRVAIARALAPEPRFLLADEPVSGLDLPLREQMKGLLQRLTREQGMGLLMVSHDFSALAGLCDRLLVMHAGEIVEDRATNDLLAAPHHPQTCQLLQAIPVISL